MIPADQLELITVAVDGELSAVEARVLSQLLDASSEARTLYAKLKADSERIRALPRATPPVDLQARVLARLATSPVPVAIPVAPRTRPETQPIRTRLFAWAPLAVAAGVFVCVTAGSFTFFANQSKSQSASARHPWSDALPATQVAPPIVPSPTAVAPREAVRPDAGAAVRTDVLPVPPIPLPRPVHAETVAIAPEPRPSRSDFLGAKPLPPLAPFELVHARVPFLRPVSELDRDDTRQELADELTRDPAFRFDLFVRDTARGAEVFQNAAKATGINVFTDSTTLDRLKKKQVGSVVIYTEVLTAADLTALFVQVCSEDAKFSPRVCDSLHATPVVRSDEIELKAILGLDVGLFKRPIASPARGAVSGQAPGRDKPVSAGTIDSLTKALTNPGDEQTAVLLTWQSAPPTLARTHPSASVELKQFLAKRGPRKPNAIPALIVIRPVGSP